MKNKNTNLHDKKAKLRNLKLNKQKIAVLTTLFIFIFCFLFSNAGFYSTKASAATPPPPDTPGNTSPKKGVGKAMGEGKDEDLRALGVSWAYQWGIAPKAFDQNVYEHVPMINARENRFDVITAVAKAHPGSYWLIFNEPDFIYQDNIKPADAAKEYNNLRSVLKAADPQAKMIVGGVFYTGTAAGGADLGWLRSFRGEYYNLYQQWPEVEGWHVHLYKGWSDYNKDIWRQTLMSVRDWMTYNGGTKELWLTEFGCLNSESMAKQIMVDQVAWLEQQPWLTRYAWYATCAGCGCSGCTGSVTNPAWAGGGLTDLGKLYATFGNPPTDTTAPAAPSGVSIN